MNAGGRSTTVPTLGEAGGATWLSAATGSRTATCALASPPSSDHRWVPLRRGEDRFDHLVAPPVDRRGQRHEEPVAFAGGHAGPAGAVHLRRQAAVQARQL